MKRQDVDQVKIETRHLSACIHHIEKIKGAEVNYDFTNVDAISGLRHTSLNLIYALVRMLE